MSLSGSCLCGLITYTCTSDPVIAVNCHCLDCKKASGSGYAATFLVPENAISITGEVKYYERMVSNGKLARRGFCPHCGSQLFTKPETMPGLIGVRAGSLTDLSQYKPQADIFASRAPAWDCMDAALPKFPEMPPLG